MVAGVFVFADHMSPRPARFNSRFNLLGQSSFLSWPIWSVNAIPESLFWCSGSQNFSQYLMALHFVFVRIGKRPTSDLHAFELQNLLTPNSHLMNFVCTNSIGSFSSFPSWSTPQTSLPYVTEYWGNNRVKNFHCELCIVSEMVAHFLPEFVQSFKGNPLYFLFSVREVPISTKL